MSRTALLAALLATAAPLAAQDDLPGVPVEPEAPDCVCPRAEGMPHIQLLRPGRAQLGVLLGEATEVNGRTGVRVEDVREGGPAARAGLQGGDILLAVEGTPLGDAPVRRIRQVMAETEPGDTVEVVFIRDGRERTVAMVTREARFGAFGPEAARMRVLRGPDMQHLRTAAPVLRFAAHALGHGGLQLVAMNEGLGEYFGVSEGVLVADVPEGSTLGLQPGDVIVAIDGRSVQDPGHARSILGSYRPDETISLEVVRDRDRVSVTGTRRGPSGPVMRR